MGRTPRPAGTPWWPPRSRPRARRAGACGADPGLSSGCAAGRSGRPRGPAAAGRESGALTCGPLILDLLAEGQPWNGYQIIQEIGARTEGVWRPSAGSVYPALQQLEDEALIRAEAAGEDRRRMYTLTEEGRAYVEAHADELRASWDAVRHRQRRRRRGPACGTRSSRSSWPLRRSPRPWPSPPRSPRPARSSLTPAGRCTASSRQTARKRGRTRKGEPILVYRRPVLQGTVSRACAAARCTALRGQRRAAAGPGGVAEGLEVPCMTCWSTGAGGRWRERRRYYADTTHEDQVNMVGKNCCCWQVAAIGCHMPALCSVAVQGRYGYRIYPERGQQEALARVFGCARVVFNDSCGCGTPATWPERRSPTLGGSAGS